MGNRTLKEQKKSFKAVIKSLKDTQFGDYTGISSLSDEQSFNDIYQRYTEVVDVQNHEKLVTILRGILKQKSISDISLLNTQGLIGKEKYRNFAYTRRGFTRPLDDSSLKQIDIIEEYITKHVYSQFKIKPGKGKIFYVFNKASIVCSEGMDLAEMRALQITNMPWHRRSKVLPNLPEIFPAGQSHEQTMHAMLDQFEKYGKEITTLVASARQIVEIGFLYSQRRGEFATFKNLLPNLKVWVNDTGFYSVNEKLIKSIFVGLDVKKVDIYNSITGALALEENPKKPGLLTLQTDLDVFYEFIPVEYVNSKGQIFQAAKRFHTGNVSVNKDYLLAVSNASGLVSITTSDIVRVINRDPLQIIYLRRAHKLNKAKENLHTYLVNKIIASLNNVLEDYYIVIRDYLVGFDSFEKRHIWAIELNKSPDLIDETVLASITNRIHKMLLQHSKMYAKAIESGDLCPPRMYILPLGGLTIFEKPKGVFYLDLSEDAEIVNKYVENNVHRVFQAANIKIL
ncbi:MAG: GH3 auxin-responsive promoter family protein [Proteobacteria bacterium]|nr:GH3 auxin-responsive promoter family protein [Pseudomonadota bacterium]